MLRFAFLANSLKKLFAIEFFLCLSPKKNPKFKMVINGGNLNPS